MASRKRQLRVTRVVLNDRSRAFWAIQGRPAEELFQITREDRQPHSPERATAIQRLLRDLSASCRKTAELLSRFREIWPIELDEEAVPNWIYRSMIDPHYEGMTWEMQCDFMSLLAGIQAFWFGAEQNVGGAERGLNLLAQYCDLRIARSRGRRRDWPLTIFLETRLITWIAKHGNADICHWNPSEDRYDVGFLDEMERTLQRLKYNYHSRDALAQRIKAVRKHIVLTDSAEDANQTMS